MVYIHVYIHIYVYFYIHIYVYKVFLCFASITFNRENQSHRSIKKVKWLVQGHTFYLAPLSVKMRLLHLIIMPLFYTRILIKKNNSALVSSFRNFFLQKTLGIASKWAGWRFWLAPKSYTLCRVSMPSSAGLQRQPQVPNTGKLTWSTNR